MCPGLALPGAVMFLRTIAAILHVTFMPLPQVPAHPPTLPWLVWVSLNKCCVCCTNLLVCSRASAGPCQSRHLCMRLVTPEKTCFAFGPIQLPWAWEKPKTASGETVASFPHLCWGTLLLNQSSNKLCAPSLSPTWVTKLLCPWQRHPFTQQVTPECPHP